MSNIEHEMQYISEHCKLFLIIAIGGNRSETKLALEELPVHCAVEYLPKYLPSRRVIRKKIEEKAAVSKDKRCFDPEQFELKEFSVFMLRSPKDYTIKSFLTQFVNATDEQSHPVQIVKSVIKFGAALIYCVLLGNRLLQEGVSLSTLFGDYIPGWADRIARDCASAMYKVWQIIRLDLETFIHGVTTGRSNPVDEDESESEKDREDESRDGERRGGGGGSSKSPLMRLKDLNLVRSHQQLFERHVSTEPGLNKFVIDLIIDELVESDIIAACI
ncbi:uncharacterized protein LOC142339723 [Convolutriloba macropyga]|uniref:uncharacterized protein LOC142339723 n=1 Tax=Convolutriloba macropyga TaxID=536237 RepID=UPI003F52378C